MFEVILKHSDGTVFWKASFISLAEANKWIAEEKTRKYWDKSYIVEITDRTPPAKTPEESAAEKQKYINIEAAQERLKGAIAIIDGDKIISNELKQVLKDLVLKNI